MFISLLTAVLLYPSDVIKFEELSYDFGVRPRTENVLTHDFVFTNSTSATVSISYAVATCSCTRLKWTSTPVQPGAQGVVTAEYHQERGYDTFEKFISVFVEGVSKPYVLRIAGSFKDNDDILLKEFPVPRGELGFREEVIAAGKSYPGKEVSGRFQLANFSDNNVTLSFADVSDGLNLFPDRLSVAPHSRVYVNYLLQPDSLVWGRRIYSFTPVIRDLAFESLSISTMLDNFSGMSSAERNASAFPVLADGGRDFGTVRKGQKAKASFSIFNKSDKVLKVRAVYSELDGVEITSPGTIGPRETASFDLTISPAALHTGRNSVKVTLVSDSALVPVLDLYINGNVR